MSIFIVLVLLFLAVCFVSAVIKGTASEIRDAHRRASHRPMYVEPDPRKLEKIMQGGMRKHAGR